MAILRGYAGKFQQVSIDEAYLDLSRAGSLSAAADLARSMKSEIRRQEGLTCSVGIGPNKIVAKIASDFQKPDGLTVVEPGRVREFLAPLPVEKIPGVGKKTGAELHRMGIATIGQLAGCSVPQLLASLGRHGVALRELALGHDDREVEQGGAAKSVSRETTFPEDTDDARFIAGVLDALADDLWRSLEEEGLRFRTLTVKVRYQGFATHTRSRTLPRFSSDREVIRRLARETFAGFPLHRKIRLIGLRLSALDADNTRQTSLEDFAP